MIVDKDYVVIIVGIGVYIVELCWVVLLVMQGFGMLVCVVIVGGVVDVKIKELIVFVIGVIQCCDGCIGFYGKVLVELGVICFEVVEVLGLCVYMGGGFVLMYVVDVLWVYDQFVGL